MNNTELLNTLKQAFRIFLMSGSRSNQKLYVLHSKIANDILSLLPSDYSCKSLGIDDNKESEIKGRYYDKKVDITFYKNGKSIAGLGVKMIMQNYSQNANNYFENMLGETANLRSNRIPYFQVFIIPDKLPYYNSNGIIEKWEEFSIHNSLKYRVMSMDNIETFAHTPTKTLLFVYHIPDIQNFNVRTKNDYKTYYLQRLEDLQLTASSIDYGTFDEAVIFNDYENFIRKTVHYILSL